MNKAMKESLKESLKETSLEPDAQLVVWAFLFPLLSKYDSDARDNAPIRVITAPSATNSNLKAQQGVFTLVKLRNALGDGTYLPLDRILEKYAERPDTQLEGYQLRKFVLPISQADEWKFVGASHPLFSSRAVRLGEIAAYPEQGLPTRASLTCIPTL